MNNTITYMMLVLSTLLSIYVFILDKRISELQRHISALDEDIDLLYDDNIIMVKIDEVSKDDIK